MVLTAADVAVFPGPEENSNIALELELNFEGQSMCSEIAANRAKTPQEINTYVCTYEIRTRKPKYHHMIVFTPSCY